MTGDTELTALEVTNDAEVAMVGDGVITAFEIEADRDAVSGDEKELAGDCCCDAETLVGCDCT